MELAGTFEDSEISAWFAEPNSWLQHQIPLDMLGRDPAAVRDAAR